MRPLAPAHLAALAGLALGVACSLYTPTFRDCALRCGDGDACPAGTTCNEGFCRPNGFVGACDCTPGESQVCGGGRGECRAGVRTCNDTRIWGPCVGEVRPASEVCDGKDNDCDGIIDEDPSDAPACALSQGVCMGATQRCIDGGYVDECGPTLYGPQYEAIEQTCDGLDNDCDGVVDSLAPRRLAMGVNVWTVRAVTGGFILFAAPEESTVLTVSFFNPLLQPLRDPVTLDVGSPITLFRTAAGGGNTAVVGLRRADNTAIMVRATLDGTVTGLGFGVAGATQSYAAAVRDDGTVVAAFERDGGLQLHTWPGGVITSTVTPYATRFPVDTVNRVTLAEDGTVLVWDGTHTDDAGTSNDVGGVESLDGGRAVARTFMARVPPIAAASRLQSFYSFSNYFAFFPISLNESGVNACFDLWQSATCTSVGRVPDYRLIRGAHSTRLGDSMAVSWIETDQLKVGISAPQVQQVRSRTVLSAGSSVAEGLVAAVPGSDLLGVFYRTQNEPTLVYGLLMCSP